MLALHRAVTFPFFLSRAVFVILFLVPRFPAARFPARVSVVRVGGGSARVTRKVSSFASRRLRAPKRARFHLAQRRGLNLVATRLSFRSRFEGPLCGL